jgi:hypothetical protein
VYRLLDLVLDSGNKPIPLGDVCEQVWGRLVVQGKTLHNTKTQLVKALMDIGVRDWTVGIEGDYLVRKPL